MFCVKMKPPVSTNKMVSWDTGHFSLKGYYIMNLLCGCGVMLFLLKVICYLCAECVSAAGQTNIFYDMITPHMKKFATINESIHKCKKSGMHSVYVVMERIIIVQDSRR